LPARIYRKWCENCQQSFTLLPADVLPGHSYGLEFVGDRLMACIDGVSLRSRDFYEQQGFVPTVSPERRAAEECSWSDRLEIEPLTPSHQLFLRWRKSFSQRAKAWLQWLLVACMLSGCDLRVRLGETLESFTRCPKDLYPLILSAGLVGLIQDQPVRSCLGQTLRLLCGSSIGAHKILQASGRPPLHYGPDLEFTSSGHR
jgi:hypothetical protein